MIDWHIVHDSREERPQEVDAVSSQTTVYERRNIRQETEPDTMTGEEFTQWVYEQREYTRAEYEQMTSPAVQGIQQSMSALELAIAML